MSSDLTDQGDRVDVHDSTRSTCQAREDQSLHAHEEVDGDQRPTGPSEGPDQSSDQPQPVSRFSFGLSVLLVTFAVTTAVVRIAQYEISSFVIA